MGGKIIDVPGQGQIEFPDSMQDHEIEAVLQKQFSQPKPADLTDIGLNAIAKGGVNLVNLPASIANVVMKGVTPPFLRDKTPQIPNYPMQAAEKLGLVNPNLEPTTPGGRILDTAVQAGTQTGLVGGPGGALAGGLIGGLSQGVTEATGSQGAGALTALLAPFAMKLKPGPAPSKLTPVGEQTLQEGRKAGYVVPPSMVRDSFLTNKLESIAGKAAVKQEAGARNQAVTNAMAAKALQLPPNTPITQEALKQVRKNAEGPYRQVEELRPSTEMEWFPRYHDKDLLEQLRQARFDKTKYYDMANKSGSPDALAKAEVAEALAESLENDIARIAKATGKPDLVQALAESRKKMAKSYEVDRATNLADANVSAPVLGRALDKGKPLTDELATIAKMQQAFPQVMREGSAIPAAGVSGTDAASAALLGTVGGAAGGGPGFLAAGLPLLRGPARNLALSEWYQNRLLGNAVPQDMTTPTMRSLLLGNAILSRGNQ